MVRSSGKTIDPVWHGVSELGYFSDAEYIGGYDLVSMQNDFGINGTDAMTVEITLNYQSTSREYIEFLRNEINGTGATTLDGDGVGGDPAYLIQDPSETYFDGLRAWGDTIWNIWTHNMNSPGAAPIEIASGSWNLSSPTAVGVRNIESTSGSPVYRHLWIIFTVMTILLIAVVIVRKRSRV